MAVVYMLFFTRGEIGNHKAGNKVQCFGDYRRHGIQHIVWPVIGYIYAEEARNQQYTYKFRRRKYAGKQDAVKNRRLDIYLEAELQYHVIYQEAKDDIYRHIVIGKLIYGIINGKTGYAP